MVEFILILGNLLLGLAPVITGAFAVSWVVNKLTERSDK